MPGPFPLRFRALGSFWVWGLLLMGGCAQDGLSQIPDTGSVEGYLCDPALDELAAEATVWGQGIHGRVETSTDSTGFFTLEELLSGSQDLTVERGGRTWTVSVTVGVANRVRLPDPPCLAPEPGTVTGRICAVESQIGSGEGYWLAGARVYVKDGATVVETTTDANGHFTLTGVPAGQRTLRVTKGSFSAEQNITVSPGHTTEVQHVCTSATTQMLVITGIFDSVEDILNGLGFTLRQCESTSLSPGCPPQPNSTGQITLYDGTATAYIEVLETGAVFNYDILFFNCGFNDPFVASWKPAAIDNLKAFVAEGGSLYVSDYAYELLRVLFNDGAVQLDFVGSEATPGAAKVGEVATTPPVSGVLLDPHLAAQVGATVDLIYKDQDWVALEASQPPEVKVWVSGDVTIDRASNGNLEVLKDAPLLVSYPYGQGKIVFTTFHQHDQSSQAMEAILRYIVFEL